MTRQLSSTRTNGVPAPSLAYVCSGFIYYSNHIFGCGNQWAKYATGTVMAPMVFVLPFATMVNVDQQFGQQEKHGGNFIRNYMGFFAALAIYEALRRKKWRDFSLIGSFVIAYLGVVSLSGFSNSERFLLPWLPCLIMMWAY